MGEEKARLEKENKEKNISIEEKANKNSSNRRMSGDLGIRHEERTRRESGRSGSGGAWETTEKIPAVKPKPVLTEEMERKIIYGSFKKESREDKLKAVKKEIEMRFKEEEEKRRREKEEREERERKERNKQR